MREGGLGVYMLKICDLWKEWYRVVSCEWWFTEVVRVGGPGYSRAVGEERHA